MSCLSNLSPCKSLLLFLGLVLLTKESVQRTLPESGQALGMKNTIEEDATVMSDSDEEQSRMKRQFFRLKRQSFRPSRGDAEWNLDGYFGNQEKSEAELRDPDTQTRRFKDGRNEQLSQWRAMMNRV
ncbi:hypothetical protein ACHWQZ_G006835 [Mnemiopsis leidyi]